MEVFPYKVEIRLSKAGNHRVAVTCRHSSGSILRGTGLAADRKALSELVEGTFSSLVQYDPAEHDKAHQLATEAAKSQSGQ